MNKTVLHCSVLLSTMLLIVGCSSTKKEDRYRMMSGSDLLQEGRSSLDGGSYKESIERFDVIEARFPQGNYAEQAKLNKIYAYYLNRDHKEALQEADNFIKLYPNHPHVDYAWYMKGLVNFDKARSIIDKFLPPDHTKVDQKQLTDSMEAFLVILDKYPNSVYAEDAAKRVIYLRNTLAQSEIHIANFYMQRKAYVGAANRAQYVIDNYDGSPAVQEALLIQVKAYRALGLENMTNDRLRILQKNYPNYAGLKSL
ncbi:outer membrane protein assembly factor BamD [Wohlfahrtiimonas chitiniclastica]|uniref:outer membrane protein assembly factor BamD n=1 Tax=Wohlfahrtiimonas chitiniclastica TaxID=400946 RepID=UPI000B983281|nr:outer membrane protein assembly factor BamD [Wohlfahrtiimonas chitiniclastica]OYQ76317.1 outer membrane protein assembly factor BamD [Wohlfahrtiimonas chitiniclastica]